MNFAPSSNAPADATAEMPMTLLGRAAQLKARHDRIAERIEKVIGAWLKVQPAFSAGSSLRLH